MKHPQDYSAQPLGRLKVGVSLLVKACVVCLPVSTLLLYRLSIVMELFMEESNEVAMIFWEPLQLVCCDRLLNEHKRLFCCLATSSS